MRRTKLSLELGDVLKPATEAKTKMDEYITDHLVDLTPQQIDGLKKTSRGVGSHDCSDQRGGSQHRGPLRILPHGRARAAENHGRGHDAKRREEAGRVCARVRQPSRAGVAARFTIRTSSAALRVTRAMDAPPPASKRLTAITSTGCGRCIPKENVEAGCQTCHSADMVLASGDVQLETINDGKDLFRQRGCNGCHRYEGYDQEPEDLNSVGQQIKQFETQKKDNLKQSAYLMKQADRRRINDEANKLNDRGGRPAESPTASSTARMQQLDFQSHSLMQDMKKIGPNLKDVRLKLNKNWIPVWLKKPTDFRPTTKMPNFRLNDHQIQAISAYIWQIGVHRCFAQAQAGNAAHGKELFETRGCLACHSIGEGDQTARRNLCREPDARRRERPTTTTSCAGFTMPASARVPIAPTRRRISVRRITPRRACPTQFDLAAQPVPE